MGLFNTSSYHITKINERLTRLEEKAFGKKKPPITLNQQILALNELGLLDIIRALEISNVKKAQLLATIIKTDVSNTKKAIEALGRKDAVELKNGFNYEYLSDLFDEVDLVKLSLKMKDKIRKLKSQ